MLLHVVGQRVGILKHRYSCFDRKITTGTNQSGGFYSKYIVVFLLFRLCQVIDRHSPEYLGQCIRLNVRCRALLFSEQ